MKDIILSLENQAMERWRNGDTGGFVKLAAEDILYVDPSLSRPVSNFHEFRSHMRKAEGQVHYQRSEFIDSRVDVIGDAALLTYNYRSTILSVERTIISQIPWNCTEVYSRRTGQWQIVHTHRSYINQKLPQTLEINLPVQLEPAQFDGTLSVLMALESAAMERWRKGDPWGFFELYTMDFTYFDTGTAQRINGQRDMQIELTSRQGKIHYPVMQFIEPQVRVVGELAVLFYRFLSTQLYPDGSIATQIPWNCTEIYVRRANQWRILHNHWSYIHGEREL